MVKDKSWTITRKTWTTNEVTAKTKAEALAAVAVDAPGNVVKTVVTAKRVKVAKE